MKLSEAIREGAKIRPQCRGSLFEKTFGFEVEESIKSCAIGAAMEGSGQCSVLDADLLLITYGYDTFRKFEGLESLNYLTRFESPVKGDEQTELDDIIIGLNDNYEWTREQIADWLQGIGL